MLCAFSYFSLYITSLLVWHCLLSISKHSKKQINDQKYQLANYRHTPKKPKEYLSYENLTNKELPCEQMPMEKRFSRINKRSPNILDSNRSFPIPNKCKYMSLGVKEPLDECFQTKYSYKDKST